MAHRIPLCVLIILSIHGTKCYDPEVEIPQGKLIGGTRTNMDGSIYYSFLSVPFGKPPVGELRFKPPEPADVWHGVRNATEDFPDCAQISRNVFKGREDCLYLNIFTPGLPSQNVTRKPVMVYIFGGKFVRGTGGETMYGAKYLLSKDVVLVMINYRVGILGFISLDDPNLGVTGNAGMKDQVLALKWVRENIEYFGGDSNNVLLFGSSSGGMSVHYQVLSPMANGLFDKAISQSGSAISHYATPQFRNNGAMIAKSLGIQTENWKKMLESLRNVDAATLCTAEATLTDTYEHFARPVVEVPSNEPSFLPEKPLDIIKSGNYNQVPYLLGFNSIEGLIYQIDSLKQTGQSILITDFTAFLPRDLQIRAGSKDEEVVSQRIKHFYYGDREPSRDNITGAVDLNTDFGFAFPVYRAAAEHVKTAIKPVYFYLFSTDTELDYNKRYNAITAAYPGATHADELMYLFYSSSMSPDIKAASIEEDSLRYMISLWTNFAIYGNPTPEDSKWKPVEKGQFNYLHIDTGVSYMEVDPRSKNFQFWYGIYDEYLPK